MTDDPVPLVVDLDHTLVGVDTLRLLRQRLAVHRPWLARQRTRLRAQGKQHEKLWLWRTVPVPVEMLPVNDALVDGLRTCGGRRTLVLATGSSHELAQAVDAHLGGLFDEIVGTDDTVNLTGPRKADRLVERYGTQGFDYIGDSEADLHVWAHAAHAYVCSADDSLLSMVRARHAAITRVVPRHTSRVERLHLVAARSRA